jgi:methylated-DNA-[protein]-cysteine S-methyltransferase
MNLINLHEVKTAWGIVQVAETEETLIGLGLPDMPEQDFLEFVKKMLPRQSVTYRDHPLFAELGIQLNEYFDRKRTKFDLPLQFCGTVFQKQVWRELLKIPYGQTVSYQELANRIENPKSVRAVGAANGANPLPIIVPCHRVIGAAGKLVGYGGGLEMKSRLLRLENVQGELDF